jgi:F0F1-type ATP synthase assembly protein I
MSDLRSRTQGDDAPDAAANPLHRASYARSLNRGFGDAMGRGLELALTLVVMVGIGWLIDRAAGTSPTFIIVLSVIGFAGTAVKLKIGYDLEMRKLDAPDAVWNRPSGEGEAPNRAPVLADHTGAASIVADQLAAEDRS